MSPLVERDRGRAAGGLVACPGRGEVRAGGGGGDGAVLISMSTSRSSGCVGTTLAAGRPLEHRGIPCPSQDRDAMLARCRSWAATRRSPSWRPPSTPWLAGERRLVVVRGEAGIGKTWLLGLAGRVGASTSARTRCRGRATELETDVPLALFREALPRSRGRPPAVAPRARWKLSRTVGDLLASAGAVRGRAGRRPLGRPGLAGAARDARPPAARRGAPDRRRQPAGRRRRRARRRRPIGWTHLRPCSTWLRSLGPPPTSWWGATVRGRPRPPVRDLRRQPAVPRGAGAGRTGRPGCRTGIAPQSRPTWPLWGRRAELVRAGAVVGDPFDIDIARRTVGLDLPVALAAVDELVDRAWSCGTSDVCASSASGIRWSAARSTRACPRRDGSPAMPGPPRSSGTRAARAEQGPAPGPHGRAG